MLSLELTHDDDLRSYFVLLNWNINLYSLNITQILIFKVREPAQMSLSWLHVDVDAITSYFSFTIGTIFKNKFYHCDIKLSQPPQDYKFIIMHVGHLPWAWCLADLYIGIKNSSMKITYLFKSVNLFCICMQLEIFQDYLVLLSNLARHSLII